MPLDLSAVFLITKINLLCRGRAECSDSFLVTSAHSHENVCDVFFIFSYNSALWYWLSSFTWLRATLIWLRLLWVWFFVNDILSALFHFRFHNFDANEMKRRIFATQQHNVWVRILDGKKLLNLIGGCFGCVTELITAHHVLLGYEISKYEWMVSTLVANPMAYFDERDKQSSNWCVFRYRSTQTHFDRPYQI